VNTDDAARALLLGVARTAIEATVRHTGAMTAPDAPILHEARGVFVTLKRAGRLRGCMGRVEPDGPLSEVLPAIAVLAATGDPRFAAVLPNELAGLHIDISLLSTPIVIAGPDEIEIGRHGLMVAARGQRGLLLPQVPSEYGWTACEFLAQTCIKAGLRADAWQHAGARLYTFETEIFGEPW
jgi:AmmeMemoRadiSam system protein A